MPVPLVDVVCKSSMVPVSNRSLSIIILIYTLSCDCENWLLARLAGMEVIDFGNFSNPITHVRRPAQPRGAGPSQLALSLSALFRCCFKQIAQKLFAIQVSPCIRGCIMGWNISKPGEIILNRTE